MWKSKIADSEIARLMNAFPSYLQQDVVEVINSLPTDKLVSLTNGQIHKLDSLIHSTEQTIFLDGECLNIPCRIYFNEPQDDREMQLTHLQMAILNCIYLRHHDGFVRQKRLMKLINESHYFIIPYTFQLLGEYVMEILEDLNRQINDTTIDKYVKFINENKKYWQQTESRVISYWNAYYRQINPDLKDYVGKQIIDRIKLSAQIVK